MQQAVSCNSPTLLKKWVAFIGQVEQTQQNSRAGLCLCQMLADSSPKTIKGLAMASDRSYLFSLWSHQLSHSYQFPSNRFFILAYPLFHQRLCVCARGLQQVARSLSFPPLSRGRQDKTNLQVSWLSFRSEHMKTAVWSFPFWLPSLIFTMWLIWTASPTESLRFIFHATFNAWQSNS